MAEKKSIRKADRLTATAEAANGGNPESANGLAASFVSESIRSNTELAKEGMQLVEPKTETQGVVASGAADVQSGSSDLSDEFDKTGVAFSSFIEGVGKAVAGAQEQFDETLRRTIKHLSETKVEVVHTFEQVLDDSGKMTSSGEAKLQSLPMSTFIPGTGMIVEQASIVADAKISEFNSKSGFDIMTKSKSGGLRLGGGVGMGTGWNVGGGFGFGGSSAQTSMQNGYSMDSAVGSMHLEATFRPRGDIELPTPILVQRGPSIAVTVTSVEDIPEQNPPANQTPKVVGKKATLTVTVKKYDGNANAGVTLDYSVDKGSINHSVPNGLTTNASGQLTIILRREGAAYDSSTALPVQVVVWLGLVSKTMTVNM